MSFGSDVETPYETIRSRDWPTIRQFAVFVENRVGQLLKVLRLFAGTRVRVVALSIVDSVDCSILRMVLSHPEQGRELIERAGLPMSESDLIGVQLPDTPQPILHVCTALLEAEVNIHHAYPLLVQPGGRSAVALHVDSIEGAMKALAAKRLTLLRESDLREE